VPDQLDLASSLRFARALQSQPEPAPSSPEEIVDLLEQLADLKEKGIITQREFEEKKKDLLSCL